MKWISWDEIREHMEDHVIEIKCYNKHDQAFIFDNKEEFTKSLHNALDKAIQKSDIEDIGEPDIDSSHTQEGV